MSTLQGWIVNKQKLFPVRQTLSRIWVILATHNQGSRCVDKSDRKSCDSWIDPKSTVEGASSKPAGKKSKKHKKHRKHRSVDHSLFSTDFINVDIRSLDSVNFDFTFKMPEEL